MNIYRHGDLSFHPSKENIKELKKIGSKSHVLALGEHTGHKHVITSVKGTCDIYQDEKTGELVLIIDGKAVVTHEEHKEIEFTTGTYRMKQEREFDYFEGIIAQVRD